MSVGVESTGTTDQLIEALGRWAEVAGVELSRLPSRGDLIDRFQPMKNPCRAAASSMMVLNWEKRHGFELPRGLRAWLEISDGFYADGPVIHPLAGIGPMVPFARMPGMMVQPESWFELGNPTETETVCVDLAYRWPGGEYPVFTSGDDLRRVPPRLIAPSFDEWFLRLLHEGARAYWQASDYPTLGDPWSEHCRRTPPPEVPDRLRRLLDRARPLVRAGVDERLIARRLDISCGEAEAMVRHLQHVMAGVRSLPPPD